MWVCKHPTEPVSKEWPELTANTTLLAPLEAELEGNKDRVPPSTLEDM